MTQILESQDIGQYRVDCACSTAMEHADGTPHLKLP